MSLGQAIKGKSNIPKNLQGDQPKAYEKIITVAAKERGQAIRSLRGYAGTGKTYLISKIVEKAERNNFRVFVTAPTHQAASVLRDHMPSVQSTLRTSTIHSLLGLQLKQDKKEGGYRLEQDSTNNEIPKDYRKCLVVVDEATMINQSVGSYIKKEINESAANWLFVGDPAQLPPPSGERSRLLDYEGETMQKIVRQQEGNPIIEAAHAIRRGEDWRKYVRLNDNKGLYQTNQPQAFVKSMVKKLKRGDYQDDPYVCRILAAHNKRVKEWNQKIKDTLFPHTPEWDKEMWCVAQDTWSEGGSVSIQNSELLFIEEAKKSYVMIDNVGLPIWVLKGKTNGGRNTTVKTLAEEGRDEYETHLEIRLDDAKRNGGGAWKRYYTLKEGLCEVRHPFSSTVHKAQGSTYETIYIDLQDISEFPGGVGMMESLKYVAFTRASKNIGILE